MESWSLISSPPGISVDPFESDGAQVPSSGFFSSLRILNLEGISVIIQSIGQLLSKVVLAWARSHLMCEILQRYLFIWLRTSTFSAVKFLRVRSSPFWCSLSPFLFNFRTNELFSGKRKQGGENTGSEERQPMSWGMLGQSLFLCMSLECARPAWLEVGCRPNGKGFCALASLVLLCGAHLPVPFIYFLNEIHFQMLLVNVWMPSTVLGMSEWRTRKWEQDLTLVCLDASSMKASEQGAKGWDGAKCLAQFTGGEFS